MYAVILALFYILCTYWIWHEKNCTSLKYRFKRYFRGGIYCIILYSLYGSIYTYLYNVYYKAIRIIDASCLRNTAYKSLHINVQFLVNICWRVKAINNVMNTRYIYIYIHIIIYFNARLFLIFYFCLLEPLFNFIFKQNLFFVTYLVPL